MQIEYNNKHYDITSYSTIENINALKTLIAHGIKLEDIKQFEKASKFLPELFNADNDVAVGEVLRSLRYRAKNNTLPQIWKDFLTDCGYNFDIPKLRGREFSERYCQAMIKILQQFVDNNINLNDIPQRASAKDILPQIFNDSNNVKIGLILQYLRTKYKTNSLPQNMLDFLFKFNFNFKKDRGRKKLNKDVDNSPKPSVVKTPKTVVKKQSDNTKQAKATPKIKNIYKKSTKQPRKKVQILKLIATGGVDLNLIENSAMASQLLPEKSISREEDFCVGKLILNAKNKFLRGELKQSLYIFLIKLGVVFSNNTTIIQTKLVKNIQNNNATGKLQQGEVTNEPQIGDEITKTL